MSHETILVLEEGLALATHGALSRRPGMACVVLSQLLVGSPDCAILTAWPVAFDPDKVSLSFFIVEAKALSGLMVQWTNKTEPGPASTSYPNLNCSRRTALDRSRGGLSRSYDHGINTAAIAAHRILRYHRHITNKATKKRKSREKGKGKGKENAADQDEDDEVERGGQVGEADWESAPAVDPTPEELETHDQDGTLLDPTEHSLCLWFPFTKSAGRQKPRQEQHVEHCWDPSRKLKVIQTNSKALRVAVVIKVGDIKSAPPAVFIALEDGSSVCLLKNCNKEDVFFFEDFKHDDEADREKRRQGWAILYRNRVRELTGKSTVTTASVSNTLANKHPGINSHPGISLGNQLSMYGAAYRQGKGIWAIGAMRDLIRRADAGDLAHRPAITNNLNIERVLDLKLDTWYDQAREAVKELCKSWSWVLVSVLARSCSTIAYFAPSWSNGSEHEKLAASVRDDVWDILGPSSPSVVGGGPGPDSIPLYRHARDALIEVAAGVDRQHQGLLTTAGTASVEVNSLAQLYEEFKNAHDTGTARVTVQQAFQCGSSQTSSSDRCT
ncbi:hypothetical protein D6D15_00959 [Aureobasidium pullulans]|uniref:Uncharacterized protein n=1 Tax=Aureobasidium pullulans TaxID=5580 RepID=A0A4S9BS16_AURPU|nr:hypothetical protein D6D15_00959 [Aureobasidium pullulans]